MSEQPSVAARRGTMPSPQQLAPPAQYLTFVLGTEVFAIGILAIKEIIEFSGTTDVPLMPPYLRGVINLRGSVVPVVDLSVRFGRPASPVTKRTCVVIIEIRNATERYDVGLVVDAVNAVLEIPPQDIEPAPTFGAGIRTDFIQGMGRINDKFVVLLDIDHILAFEDVQTIAAASESAADAIAN